jgi:hypothetical protein
MRRAAFSRPEKSPAAGKAVWLQASVGSEMKGEALVGPRVIGRRCSDLRDAAGISEQMWLYANVFHYRERIQTLQAVACAT